MFYANPPPTLEESLKDFYSDKKEDHKSLRIASQYSFNMYCQSQSGKVKFRKPSKHTQRSSDVLPQKYTTSLNGIDQVKEPKSKSNAKSVLELMARSVEVRAEPSSQS